MGITINAENLEDARDKLGVRDQHWPIKVRFRKADYGQQQLPGCIVDAVGAPDQDVPRQFLKSSDALRYIAAIMKKRDEFVRSIEKAEKARLRKAAKADSK